MLLWTNHVKIHSDFGRHGFLWHLSDQSCFLIYIFYIILNLYNILNYLLSQDTQKMSQPCAGTPDGRCGASLRMIQLDYMASPSGWATIYMENMGWDGYRMDIG